MIKYCSPANQHSRHSLRYISQSLTQHHLVGKKQKQKQVIDLTKCQSRMLLETKALPSLSTQPHAVFFPYGTYTLCISNLLRLLIFLRVTATQEAQRNH